MTRIIGGSAGGRRLQTPKGELTRPTSDRVREALFSAIESTVGSLVGLRFLDLYAGSGAVGLEALSRGAAAATLVEHDRRTAGLIRTNARAVGLRDAEVVTGSVTRHLTEPPAEPYDIVFIDPPYDLVAKVVPPDLLALRADGWLVPDAMVVVEHSSRAPLPALPAGFDLDRERRYGETTLTFATWTASPERVADPAPGGCYGRHEPEPEPHDDEVV